MSDDYSELLKMLGNANVRFAAETQDEAAIRRNRSICDAIDAIRALVEERDRLREALGVLTACASSDDAFGLEDALSNARAALGETK
jgi:hypothetical protein